MYYLDDAFVGDINAYVEFSCLPRKLEIKLIAGSKRVQHQLPSICFTKYFPLLHVIRLLVFAMDGTSTT